jgi:hypothetical protein
MTVIFGHIQPLNVKKDGSKAQIPRNQVVAILKVDAQFALLLDSIPKDAPAYDAIAKARHQLFVGSQYLLGCQDFLIPSPTLTTSSPREEEASGKLLPVDLFWSMRSKQGLN